VLFKLSECECKQRFSSAKLSLSQTHCVLLCLHDSSSSRGLCTTCALAVTAADDNVCIAKYENCTLVCNFLDKAKVKFTI